MAGLSSLVNGIEVSKKLNITSSKQATTKDNVVALAIINEGVLPAFGGDYIDLSAGTIVYNFDNAAAIARDAAIRGSAKFFTNGTINGTRSATPKKADTTYGDNVTPEEINEEMVTFGITYKNAWLDPNGIRNLRGHRKETIFVFTNNTIEILEGAKDNVSIGDVVLNLGGSSSTYAKGTFNVFANLDGTVEPYKMSAGINPDLDTPVRLTVTQGALTALTAAACSGDYKVFTSTAAGSMQLSANANVNCLSWSLFEVSANGSLTAVTSATKASISTATGLVTVPTGHVSGQTKYVAIVENQSGVIGEFKFAIQK